MLNITCTGVYNCDLTTAPEVIKFYIGAKMELTPKFGGTLKIDATLQIS